MMRTFWVPAVLALAMAAACGPGRPALQPEQWIVLREEAGQRASLETLGIRIEKGDIRRALVAVDYASVQEKDDVRYDREETYLRIDCRRGAVHKTGGGHYLGGEMASVWTAGSGTILADGTVIDDWEEIAPGSFLADAMRHVCGMQL